MNFSGLPHYYTSGVDRKKLEMREFQKLDTNSVFTAFEITGNQRKERNNLWK